MSNNRYLLPNHSVLEGTQHKYVIEHHLGSGGFGITYKAFYEEEIEAREGANDIAATAQLSVAIKELFIEGKNIRNQDSSIDLQGMELGQFINFKDKFLEEARMLSKFRKDDSIIHVIDYFEQNGTAYMVTEFVGGNNLEEILKAEVKLPENKATKYITQIATTLMKVHKAGVSHRDIKPANIIVTPDDKAVLIDFGAARGFVADRSVTQSVILTHGYAPIEQYSLKRKRGPFTDIYALGATLYKCVTGARPVNAMDIPSKGLALEDYQLSDNIKNTLKKAMAFDPADRFQNTVELMAALESGNISETNKDTIVIACPYCGHKTPVPINRDVAYDCPSCNEEIIVKKGRLRVKKVLSKKEQAARKTNLFRSLGVINLVIGILGLVAAANLTYLFLTVGALDPGSEPSEAGLKLPVLVMLILYVTGSFIALRPIFKKREFDLSTLFGFGIVLPLGFIFSSWKELGGILNYIFYFFHFALYLWILVNYHFRRTKGIKRKRVISSTIILILLLASFLLPFSGEVRFADFIIETVVVSNINWIILPSCLLVSTMLLWTSNEIEDSKLYFAISTVVGLMLTLAWTVTTEVEEKKQLLIGNYMSLEDPILTTDLGIGFYLWLSAIPIGIMITLSSIVNKVKFLIILILTTIAYTGIIGWNLLI